MRLGDIFSPESIIRYLIGAAVAGGAAWGISFFIADYVADKYLRGFESSVAQLSGAINELSGRLQSESTQLRSERLALAEEIARKVADAQGQQDQRTSNLAFETRVLATQLSDTTRSLEGLSASVVALDRSIQAVDESVQLVDSKLTNSISAQRDFERFVFGVLLQGSPPPSKSSSAVIDEWGINQQIYNATVTPALSGSLVGDWFARSGIKE